MGRSLLDLLTSKIELFRLEQRYTKRRHRRSTFVSDAVYVDGEYVYNYDTSSPPSHNSSVRGRQSKHAGESSSSVDVSSEGHSGPRTPRTHSGRDSGRDRGNMPGFGQNGNGPVGAIPSPTRTPTTSSIGSPNPSLASSKSGSNNPYRRSYMPPASASDVDMSEQHEREGQFGSFTNTLERPASGGEARKSSRWGGSGRLDKRRSMLTVREVRWEDQER